MPVRFAGAGVSDSFGLRPRPTGTETKTRGIDPHRKQVLPHRGLFDNSESILENTISAADNALKYGFHGVELDLRADKNGHAWMIHDTTLGRVTGDPNNCLIPDISTDEIKNMSLSKWNPVTRCSVPRSSGPDRCGSDVADWPMPCR
ncbi:glycerophosphodiester phosphodiesterase family protein [Mesorhizobium helmanticense]|uniref:GP-PDE domain-containing protein n=1 Tax=Mesorhizobium helmanticense TaxID=1776423 RepID=A0A2T4IKH5_9HYPH|nr:hypothetical protein C9427_33540 [Mesorhizobium helmanticense]